jgi:hypothetical protein
METPKPKPFKSTKAPEEKPAPVKRQFVRQEHLTSKPFRENEGLRALQSELRKKEARRPHNPKAKRQR